MQNKGQIIALDIFEWKLAELKRRAKRAGAHNIETRMISDNKVIKRLHEKADRLLIDAPCSGLGVLKEIRTVNGKSIRTLSTELKRTAADSSGLF
jgi:16S rRNA (cytosine967-C5)-methyltransferase